MLVNPRLYIRLKDMDIPEWLEYGIVVLFIVWLLTSIYRNIGGQR